MPWHLTLDRDASVPLWKQLVEHTARLVDEGAMAGGAHLPATRVLAARLGINRSTVCRAYEELAALGYLESRSGSYTTIRGRTRPLSPGTGARALIDWDAALAPGVRRAREAAGSLPRLPPISEGWVDLSSLAADPALCPGDDFRRAVRAVLLEQGPRVLDYGDPAGYRPLRDTLARRMAAHRVAVSPEEILVTQGAQHALDLVVRLVARPGASVVVESPTYGMILPLLRLHQLRPVEIALRADGGMDLDALEAALARERPALVYTVPTFQNPTGLTASQAHRERLLALCERHRVPIAEDGFEEEMKYFGRGVLPIKSMDARGVVIYVGTFSKAVFPGLRVGWIAAERQCIDRLLWLSRFSTLSGNALTQAAIERFCHEGRYDHYLRRLHATLRRRMTTLLRSLARHLDGVLDWTRPSGGCTLWATVPGRHGDDEQRLVDLAARERVAIAPGSAFFATAPDRLACRLSVARVKTHEIDEGCRRLARAVKGLASRRPPSP